MQKIQLNANVNPEIEKKIQQAQKALTAFLPLSQETVDHIVHKVVMAIQKECFTLAQLAVTETGRGNLEDKAVQNMDAAKTTWDQIRDWKTVGLIQENPAQGYAEYAYPAGILAAACPVTNPCAVAIFKSLICLKTRNPVLFAFPASSSRASVKTAELIYETAREAGAPPYCIQWLDNHTAEATQTLLHHKQITAVLATGGTGMVKAAFGTEKETLFAGPANVPCYIHSSANLEKACSDIIHSKLFDYGLTGCAEQTVIVDEHIAENAQSVFQKNHGYFLTEKETDAISAYIHDRQKNALRAELIGKPVSDIAEICAVQLPEKVKLLLAKADAIEQNALFCEKAFPLLVWMTARDSEDAIKRVNQNLALCGLKHTAVIHAQEDAVLHAFAEQVPAFRTVKNGPSTKGLITDMFHLSRQQYTLYGGVHPHNAGQSAVRLVQTRIRSI